MLFPWPFFDLPSALLVSLVLVILNISGDLQLHSIAHSVDSACALPDKSKRCVLAIHVPALPNDKTSEPAES
jgi:hypothetical protein